MSIVRSGARVRVEFEMIVPADATQDEIEAWVRFETGSSCSLSVDNPLDDHDLGGIGPVMLTLVRS